MCSELALVDVAVEKLQAEKKDLADGLAFMKHRIVIKADVGRVICAFTGTTAAPVINPLMGTGNYTATLNNMKSVRWPLMGGLLHLVQRGGDWAGPQPIQAPPHCTKCNSSGINSQCTNHRIAV